MDLEPTTSSLGRRPWQQLHSPKATQLKRVNAA